MAKSAFQRHEEYQTVTAAYREPVFIHPSSIIDGSPDIGMGTKIWHFCHVMKDAVIGKDCIIGQNCFVADGVVVGDSCKIQNNVSLYNGVVLKNYVFIGPSVVFTNVLTPRAAVNRKDQYKTTLVKDGASIGANATIICGVTIGRYALIGAGSVITRDVPDYAVMVGNPAKRIKWACRCGEMLEPYGSLLTFKCRLCGQGYTENGFMLKANDE